MLKSLGFDDAGRMNRPVRTLSGGWRMKLGLARAVLQNSDVLLLDEPTGHLDRDNFKWLVEYVETLKADRLRMVTTIVVSHHTEFLDKVCTHIIHVQGQKLRTYAGNFSDFIQRVPDAQLGSAMGEDELPVSVFTLPEPGMLDGVKSIGKRFLFLEDAEYTYPGSGIPAVRRATVECSLRSRVALVGPNGAGKSTLAGLVVGELSPDAGKAWRHPNLRVAFVAQHAFHHLEQHMDLTATQYILWRFNGNQDREAMDFRAEDAECEEPKSYMLHDGRLIPCQVDHPYKAEPEVIVDRRQRGRLGYEYEMRWRNHNETTWLPRFQVASMGCLGMAKREDERQAAQQALATRSLTTPSVQEHLAGFGLNSEEATHRRLGSLSNGQRARVVLGAATWLAPHLLVLDEPSNYLDNPALSALAAGLQGFGGGVVVISHNTQLLKEVCSERWSMMNGVLRREGTAGADDVKGVPLDGSAPGQKPMSCVTAALQEARERKKQKRLKELRRKNGEEVSDGEEEWWEDLKKKVNKKTT